MAVEYKVVRVREQTHRRASVLASQRDQSIVSYFAKLVDADWNRHEAMIKRMKSRKKGAK